MEKKMLKVLSYILIILAALTIGCSQRSATDGLLNKTGNQSSKLYPNIIGFEVKYCEGLGYTYEYRLNDKGKYIGYCRLTKEIECTSDEFASGLCHREFSLCEIKGYTLKIGVEKHENLTITYPICIFPDGSYCKEVDFFYKNCHLTW